MEGKAPCLRKDLGQQIERARWVPGRGNKTELLGRLLPPKNKARECSFNSPRLFVFPGPCTCYSEPGSLLKIRFQNFCIISFGRFEQLTVWSPRGRAERRWKGPLGKFTEDRTIGDLTQQRPNAPPRQTITGSQTRAHTHIHTHTH